MPLKKKRKKEEEKKEEEKSADFETLLRLFVFLYVKGFSSKHSALKVDVLQDRKIYCFQERPCIFQPGNLTGSSSERVNTKIWTG